MNTLLIDHLNDLKRHAGLVSDGANSQEAASVLFGSESFSTNKMNTKSSKDYTHSLEALCGQMYADISYYLKRMNSERTGELIELINADLIHEHGEFFQLTNISHSTNWDFELTDRMSGTVTEIVSISDMDFYQLNHILECAEFICNR